jgi:hypothetical protein
MKKPTVPLPPSTVRISGAGTWWSTKRVRKPSVPAAVVAVAGVVGMAVAVAVIVEAVAVEAAVEIVVTVEIAETAGKFLASLSSLQFYSPK